MQIAEQDYVVQLNNLLQAYSTANLTSWRHAVAYEQSSDRQMIHIATVMFRGQPCGMGRGITRAPAKRNAAREALDIRENYICEISLNISKCQYILDSLMEYFRANGIPDRHEGDSTPVRDLQNYLRGHPGGSLVPWFSWSVSQTGPDHQKIYHATALFDGSDIGRGEGASVENAKTLAAIYALRYLRDNPQPPPPPHPQKGRMYNMKDRMIDWESIFDSP
ncbi:hypothetical protein F5148DRAFT_1193633 [Russula earlei]|uniref:Uncharacterized protein n=1 Tax=Russula earlei TaxID=71964 RepID=A0ACC0UAR2_9AGAM|nr:hypothetical protein F5148DRAFT_1193633 [Russula earlei]